MSDEARALLRELKQHRKAVGQVLTLCMMPKKTEAALTAIYHRAGSFLAAYEKLEVEGPNESL